MRLLGAALMCLLLAACGRDEPPRVDWSNVPANQRTAIESAVRAKDCTQMQTYFNNSKDSDVLRYLDWHLKDAGCY
jgi:hypothetical protein